MGKHKTGKSNSTWTLVVLLVGFLLVAESTSGQETPPGQLGRPGFTATPALSVPDAAVDPTTGDLLIISNSWPDTLMNLRRYHQDGSPDTTFALRRFESCCSINPSLVTVDKDGNIFTLEFQGGFDGFYIYKHAPNGELDLEWGYGETSTSGSSSSGPAGSGYQGGETSLSWTAGGGRLQFNFYNPVDMIARQDGSLLVLDQSSRCVFLVDPQGHGVTEFIGARGYIAINPFRLLSDPAGNLYLLDYYDPYDLIRGNKVGIFKFTADGTLVSGWGESSDGINDPYRPDLDFKTLVTDGNGKLIALGSNGQDMNHGLVHSYDPETGMRESSNPMQYLYGPDVGFLGMLGNPGGGLIHLAVRDFAILVDYYGIDGKRAKQVTISDLYPAEG
jgi:hypothetical protein